MFDEVVISACKQLLHERPAFWLLAALAERSFEEGACNDEFGRVVDSYRQSGLSTRLLAQLRLGINGNLAAAIAAQMNARCRMTRNKAHRRRERPDIRLATDDGAEVLIEVKATHSNCRPKWYPHIAADADKLRRHRARGFAGHLIQVVFFVQLPHFDYPAGSFYEGNWKRCGCRGNYIVFPTITKQYQALRREMDKAPCWPGDRAYSVQVAQPSARVCAAIRRWCDATYRPATPWKFDPSSHLRKAAAGCAIWTW